MISELILDFVYTVASALFNLLPTVTIADIPFVGASVSSLLASMVLIWNAFMVTFPYAVVVWFCFKIVLAFELILLTARLIMGNRLPVGHKA